MNKKTGLVFIIFGVFLTLSGIYLAVTQGVLKNSIFLIGGIISVVVGLNLSRKNNNL